MLGERARPRMPASPSSAQTTDGVARALLPKVPPISSFQLVLRSQTGSASPRNCPSPKRTGLGSTRAFIAWKASWPAPEARSQSRRAYRRGFSPPLRQILRGCRDVVFPPLHAYGNRVQHHPARDFSRRIDELRDLMEFLFAASQPPATLEFQIDQVEIKYTVAIPKRPFLRVKQRPEAQRARADRGEAAG